MKENTNTWTIALVFMTITSLACNCASQAQPPISTVSAKADKLQNLPKEPLQTGPLILRPTPMPTHHLRSVSSRAFSKGSVRRDKTVYQGEEASVWGAMPELSRLLLRVASKNNKSVQWILTDTTNAREVARIGKPLRQFSATELVVNHQGRQAIASLVDGSMLVPQPTMPNGQTVKNWWYVGEEFSDKWLLGMSTDGKLYIGAWRDRSLYPKLQFPLATFESMHINALANGASYLIPSPASDCVAYLLGNATVECVGAADEMSKPKDIFQVGRQGPKASLTAIESGRQRVVEFDCAAPMNIAHVLKAPPTALAYCSATKHSEEDWLWLGPSGARSYRRRPSSSHHNLGTSSQRFRSLASFIGNDHGDTWIDLELGVLYDHDEELEDLQQSTTKRVLAGRGADEQRHAVVLDFSKPPGMISKALNTPCADTLFAVGSEGCSSLYCAKQERPKQWRFELQWSKLVDIDQGRYYDLPGFPEAVLAPNKVLISNRTHYTEESHAGATEYYVVLLQ